MTCTTFNIADFCKNAMLKVSASDSDITIRSSDGVLFKVHRTNLARHSDGFPAEDMVIPSKDEVVDLTETSETLELLFQYTYPSQAKPPVASLPTSEFYSLAEAAEKYGVSSAIDTCMVHLRFVIFYSSNISLKILILTRSGLLVHC